MLCPLTYGISPALTVDDCFLPGECLDSQTIASWEAKDSQVRK